VVDVCMKLDGYTVSAYRDVGIADFGHKAICATEMKLKENLFYYVSNLFNLCGR